MADFKQACRWALNKKKCHINLQWYMVIEDGKIKFRDKDKGTLTTSQALNLHEINSERWEVYEDGRTLASELKELEDFCPETHQRANIYQQLAQKGAFDMVLEREKEQVRRCKYLFNKYIFQIKREIKNFYGQKWIVQNIHEIIDKKIGEL